MDLKKIGLIGIGAAAAAATVIALGAGDVPDAEFNVGGQQIEYSAECNVAIPAAAVSCGAWEHDAGEIDYLRWVSDGTGAITGRVVAPLDAPPSDARSITPEYVEALKLEAAAK